MIEKVQLSSLAELTRAPVSQATGRTVGTSFAAVLDQTLQKHSSVRFSAHAQARLSERGIRLTAADEAQIGRALDAAAAKGARETLVITDQYALVASVPNRTVITAIPRNELDNAVFTNIDSAVVLAPEAKAPTL